MAYVNLRGEMAKKHITNESVANLLGIHRNSVYNKINGESKFSIDEALAIRNAFFPNFDVDTLFGETETGGEIVGCKEA